MDGGTDTDAARWLFLDLNSYFASCEQQENPRLRGKPVIIVQTEAETACAIAASYEAKRRGVRTGALVRDARQMCPDVVLVKARHKLYSQYHDRVVKAVDTCLPVEKILSIDEMACRLMRNERPMARDIALRIKKTLREQVGECMTCSIGIAPNLFLGKVASDLQKPDGLVVLTPENMPGPLLGMPLRGIYGIGRRMEARLNLFGIGDVAALWKASSALLRRVWGGVRGALFYQMLHGVDVQPPETPHAKSISHQHVLEPSLRTSAGGRDFARHLLAKAAERLRRNHYYCRRLGVGFSWQGDQGGWWRDVGFHETGDTGFLLERLDHLLAMVPPLKPLMVSVVLLGLVPAERHQGDLFDAAEARGSRLSPVIDRLNQKYGRYAVGFGLLPQTVRNFKGHAAFQRVPEEWEF